MSGPHPGWEDGCECDKCEEDQWITCYCCPKVLRFSESWSPGDADGALCDDCDTEVSGRDHTLDKLARIRRDERTV